MRRIAYCCLSVASTVMLTGCVHFESTPKLIARSEAIPMPQPVDYHMADINRDFGLMLVAYTGQAQPIPIEIDLIPNNSGISQELPTDVGGLLVAALSKMDRAFKTGRTYESLVILNTPAALGYSQEAPQRTRAPFKLKGELLGYRERVIRGREVRGSGMGKIEGGEFDVELGGKCKFAIRSLRVALYLADANGGQITPTATYQVWVAEDEKGANFSFYFKGTGAGISSEVQINHDAGDAAFDALSAALIEVLGTWLELPIHRLSPVFRPNPIIEERFADTLAIKTRRELEAMAKRFMFCSGVQMDMTVPELVGGDQAKLALKMAESQLDLAKRDDLCAFIRQYWTSLDYRAASKRVKQTILDNTLEMREIAERAAGKAAISTASTAGRSTDPAVKPLPAKTVVSAVGANTTGKHSFSLDLRRLGDSEQSRLLALLRTLKGITIAPGTVGSMYEITLFGRPIDVQLALLRAGMNSMTLIWGSKGWDSAVAVPK